MGPMGSDEYCGGAIFVGTALVLWVQCCANGDCCQLLEGGERNKRIESRKAVERGCGQSPGWWKRSTVGE